MTTERELAEAAGLDQSDPRFETAIFGREAEDFIDNHPIGKYLITRAREDLEAAKEALVTVDPQDAILIREIQSRARTAENVRKWLHEAVIEGRNAEVSLEQERAANGRN